MYTGCTIAVTHVFLRVKQNCTPYTIPVCNWWLKQLLHWAKVSTMEILWLSCLPGNKHFNTSCHVMVFHSRSFLVIVCPLTPPCNISIQNKALGVCACDPGSARRSGEVCWLGLTWIITSRKTLKPFYQTQINTNKASTLNGQNSKSEHLCIYMVL